MRYLVVTEGELYKIINGWDKVVEYLNNLAQELKARECENVDQWLHEMLEDWKSNVYNCYPDFVLPFNEDQIEYLD